MNIIKRIYSLVPVIVLFTGLALILIPVPMKFIEVLIVLDYFFAICLFLIKLVNRNKLNWYPKLTVIFSVVTCGIASGIIEFKMFWEDAVKKFFMLSCGYLAVFVIPIFLVSLSFRPLPPARCIFYSVVL